MRRAGLTERSLLWRSMINYVALARELGYLSADDKMIIPAADVYKYAPNQVVVMTTGSQGEPFSGLVLMSKESTNR